VHVVLHVCDTFAVDYGLKFKTAKSVAMRVGGAGPCFNVNCAALTLAGENLSYLETVKYFGVYLVAAKCFKCFWC